jgi:hypothetical protein
MSTTSGQRVGALERAVNDLREIPNDKSWSDVDRFCAGVGSTSR